jgi:hypothetical protein
MLEVSIDYCTKDLLDFKYPGLKKTCRPKTEADKIIGAMQIYVPVLT